MHIHTELDRLQRDLSGALKEVSYANSAVETAQTNYANELAKWEAQHPRLVEAKNLAYIRQANANAERDKLLSQANELLSSQKLTGLPFGFAQSEKPRVRYEAQGLRVIAISHFPFLLNLNTDLVEEFFTKMAKREEDGVYVLPENIRSTAAVEVVCEYIPVIDTEAVRKLFFLPKPANDWQPPDNAIAILTTPGEEFKDTQKLPERGLEDTDKLLGFEDDNSSAGESIPMNPVICDNAGHYSTVPATEEI